jgi:hypothetical protein
MQQNRSRTEEFTLNGDEVVAKVKELINEGNIRRLIIRTEDGRTLVEIPLTVGLVGSALAVAVAPVIAAIGALAALVTRLSIIVERTESDAAGPEATGSTRGGAESSGTPASQDEAI